MPSIDGHILQSERNAKLLNQVDGVDILIFADSAIACIEP